ncbi:MAG: hypothetical protein ACYCST_12420 [Acidimicrobiales bacterium]
MIEGLEIFLGVLVVGSLVAIVGYLLVFVVAAVSTVLGARRAPSLTDELDQVLADIFAEQMRAELVGQSVARIGRHR